MAAVSLLAVPAARAEAAADLAGTPVVFANLAQARQALQASDEWMQVTSAFQRAATMGQGQASAPSLPAFAAFLASTALPWEAGERARWQQAIDTLAVRLNAMNLARALPSLLLVQTDGRDAAGAPYTRGQSIFLPRGFKAAPYSDVEVLAHEYFHVLSRLRPTLADRLYAELGYTRVAELDWPPEWLPARIANPDAPLHRHAMALVHKGQTRFVMPVLVARRTDLQPHESFFDVLDVRLLTVAPGQGVRPTQALRDMQGRLEWSDANLSQDYLQRLGGNTAYVFHPEETAADNFAYLVSGRSVPNPSLTARFVRLLQEDR